MPLYEFNCRTCAHTFEVLTTRFGVETARCPECDGTAVDRLIGLPAKGSASESGAAGPCVTDGPPCGAPWCRRNT
jgi:putative FmdB family regulatory protein